MKNKKYYPFERNHYFYGKLLTVRDFENEQTYMNDKRRLANRMLHGAGVISGLDVIQVDEQTISLEMGFALDYEGREIIVDESVTRKLSMIEGFDQIKDMENVYLCIAYDETLKEPVHSVANSSADMKNVNEFNRVHEIYRLFLVDHKEQDLSLTQNDLLETKKVLFEAKGVKVEQSIPKYVNPNGLLEIQVAIEKKNVSEPIELNYILESDYLEGEDKQKQVRVYYKEQDSETHRKIHLAYYLQASDVVNIDANVTVQREQFSIQIGEQKQYASGTSEYTVEVTERPIKERMIEEYYKKHFDDLTEITDGHLLYLAKIQMITSDHGYFIENIEKLPFRQYVLNSQLLELLSRVDGQKEVDHSDEIKLMEEKFHKLIQQHTPRNQDTAVNVTTGVERIEIDSRNSRKFYSYEIAHGLGAGPVRIELAVEDDYDASNVLEDRKMFFGDQEVFRKSPYEPAIPCISVGAISYVDKGTFRIGVFLQDKTNLSKVRVRWWAYKHSEAREKKEEGFLASRNVNIFISPNTLTIAPREKGHFTAAIEGTDEKECRWYVREKNGGWIDFNGIYEAPSQEGVYEVVVESVKYPMKQASAYVVVKAK